MNINLVWDSSVINAPEGFKTAMQFAATTLDGLITNNITVNINVGYGEYTYFDTRGPHTDTLDSTVSEGGIGVGPGISYSALVADLQAHATTTTALQAVASLPANDPTLPFHPGSGSSFLITNAQQKAWGLLSPTATGNDGSVGFGAGGSYDFSLTGTPASGKLDFVAVAEHELTHALGRFAGLQQPGPGWYSPLDLFRYQAPGSLELQSGAAAYFSVDGGHTNLSNFATSSDLGDWAGSTSNTDAFNAISFTGQDNGLTAADLASLAAIGFTVACFARGTCMATPDGKVAVEALCVGQNVTLADGGEAPVQWLGHRAVDCARHPRPWDVWPVRVQAGAFAPGLPSRDLFLSPDHAVFVRGALIPVRYLLNGASIAQIPVERVEYWHVELPAHAVLLAEDLPCESYLDTGNRAAFAGGAAVDLHADFARRTWRARGCTPLLLRGPRVAAARRRLLARAAALGHEASTDPALIAEADGRILPLRRDGARCVLRLPHGAARLRLRSRTWSPAEMDPASTDTRRLGVAVAGLHLDGRRASLESRALGAGWHAVEAKWRWTAGDAWLDVAGAREVAFELVAMGRYWRAAPLCQGLTHRRA